MADYLGDYATGSTITMGFNTQDATGAPITISGATVSIYKQGSTTEVTTGVTLTTDYDSRTGWHRVVIDTSSDGTFYAAGNDFIAVLTAGTVNGISVVGKRIGQFSLQNRYLTAAVIAAAVWAIATSTLTTAGTIGKRIVDFLTGDAYTRLGAPAGPSLAADIAAAKSDTAGIKTQTDKLLFDGSNYVKSDPQTLANAGDFNATQKTSVTAAVPAADTIATSVWNAGTRTLTGFGTLVADIAAAVWAATSRTLTAFAFTVNTNPNAVEDAIKAKTDGLPADPADASDLAAAFSTTAAAIATRASQASVDAIPTASQIAAAILVDGSTNKLKVNSDNSVNSSGGGSGGGSGTGAFPVVCHVTDSEANNLQGVMVAAYVNGLPVATGTTDVDGETELGLDAFSTKFVLSASGYYPLIVTRVISSSAQQDFEMTLREITPSPAGKVTGVLYAEDVDGTILGGVPHFLKFAPSPDRGQTGTSFDPGERTVDSAEDGLVQFPNLTIGAGYMIRRRSGKWLAFVATDSGNGTCPMPDCNG